MSGKSCFDKNDFFPGGCKIKMDLWVNTIMTTRQGHLLINATYDV